MAFTKTKLNEIKSRLVAGKVMEILDKKDLLSRVEHLGMKEWNGKQVMVNKLTALTLKEQEELEKEITEQIDIII